MRNMLFPSICVVLVWIETPHFFFKKQVLIGLIKAIGMKDYFCITFCSNLMYNKDIKGYKFVCVGVFNVLLHTKSEQKVIGNWFYAQICVGCVWIVIGYFLFENRLLMD